MNDQRYGGIRPIRADLVFSTLLSIRARPALEENACYSNSIMAWAHAGEVVETIVAAAGARSWFTKSVYVDYVEGFAIVYNVRLGDGRISEAEVIPHGFLRLTVTPKRGGRAGSTYAMAADPSFPPADLLNTIYYPGVSYWDRAGVLDHCRKGGTLPIATLADPDYRNAYDRACIDAYGDTREKLVNTLGTYEEGKR